MKRKPFPWALAMAAATFLDLAAVTATWAHCIGGPAPQGGAQEKSAAGQAEAPPAPAAGVSGKPRVLFESEDGSVMLLNRVQVRWTEDLPDESVQLPGTTKPGEGKGAFRIRRAKTEITGWIWKKELTYEIQLSWAGPEPGASTQTPLEDFLLAWDVSKNKTFRVTIGQFKVPLGRQEMTSSGRQQFADRDILSFEFTRGRDVGVQIDGLVAGGKIEYLAGVFNGNPASRLGNDNSKYQYNARVTFQPWGSVGYSECDFESKDKPLLAIAAELEHNDLHGATTLNDLRTTIIGGDLVFKFKGFSAFTEYFARDRKPETGPSFGSNGWHAQVGYFLKRDKVEAALRYARFDPTDEIPDNDQIETGGALSYFLRKHGLKVVADFRQLENRGRKTKDKELRVQTQVMF